MSLYIEAGDLVGVQGSSWLSDQIRASTGNGPLSHIAIVTATQPFVQVTEALSRVVVRSWEDRLADAAHLWLLKSPLSLEDRVAACRTALTHVGQDYGYENIIWQELDDLSKSRWFTEHMVRLTSDDICSELASICETKLGLRSESATPNDFWGWWTVQRWPMEQLK